MARTWGATRAKFWDIVGYGPGLLWVTVGGDTYLETVVDNSVTWTRLISQVGQGAASFYAVGGWEDWLIPGRICVVEKVTNHTAGAARLLACFIIEEIEPKVSGGVNVVDVRGPGVESLLTKQLLWNPIGSGTPEPMLADGFQGIDADSSPLRFRACFHTPMSQAMLTETYKVYDTPTPLNGPSWFDCFDAAAIGAALQSGEAIAFLSQANIAPSIDRVVAVFPDGRAYAWHQLSPDAEE